MFIIRLVLLVPLLAASKPCPEYCSCNFGTLSCTELVHQCAECKYWTHIEFNQINQLNPDSFSKYSFSNQTHVTIYKLLNSSIPAYTFRGLIIPDDSIVQITFQYNSLIRFEPGCLSGLKLGSNSTLIFNFPYTTQVVFSFAALNLIDSNDSRLIFKIFKSFSVNFLPTETVNLNKIKVVFDIKSTHLVKIDTGALTGRFTSTQIYFDFESIEKVILNKQSIANSSLDDKTRFVFYLKQLTFLDIKSDSFYQISLNDSKLFMYLFELSSSLCVQPNTFNHLTLRNSVFNLSVIYSKNVQFMAKSFNNITSKESKMFIGVFDSVNLEDLFLKDKHEYQNLGRQEIYENFQFFYHTKQKYTYNLSVERSAFVGLTSGSLDILADSLDTVYFDNGFITSPLGVKLYVNVKNLVLDDLIDEVVFIEKPKVVRLNPKLKLTGISDIPYEGNYTFLKQWEYCINEEGRLIDQEVSGILSSSHTSFYYEETDNQIENNSTQTDKSLSTRVTGIFIIGLILLILFLILIVNLVQYKYRGDVFDDLETSSQNVNGAQNLLENKQDDCELTKSCPNIDLLNQNNNV